MNKLLQAYLTIIATIIMLFLAAILVLMIVIGVKVSEEVRSLDAKANDLKSQITTFNDDVKKLNPFD